MSTTSPREPLRPLGQSGLATWRDLAPICPTEVLHLLQIVCEQIDERNGLRVAVLQQQDPTERRALRSLDRQISENLQAVLIAIEAEKADDAGFTSLLRELSAPLRDSEDGPA